MTPSIKAFISHSRVSARLAKRLTRRINTYRPPSAADLDSRKLEAFLDVDDLTVGGSLPDRLRDEVLDSDFLVLLATPEAAESDWVKTEVEVFTKSKGDTSVLPILVKGTPEQSFPPSLSVSKALFLDFRKNVSWPFAARAFRLDSLRVIAALYGVDYRQLRREDERRRRFRFVSAGVALALSLVAFGALYLSDTVPERSWELVPQPDSGYNEVLRPIMDVAVHKQDPSQVIWHGKNASWVEADPDDHGAFEISLNSEPLSDLLQDELKSQPRTLDGSLIPLAQIDFRFEDNEVVVGTASFRVFGYRQGEDSWFYLEQHAKFPATKVDDHIPPTPIWFNGWAPWPAERLEDWGYAPYDHDVTGRVLGLANLPTQEVDIVWISPDEGIPEANEIRQEFVIFSNVEFDQFAGEIDEYSEWEKIEGDPLWALYQPPAKHVHRLMHEGDSGEANDATRAYLAEELPDSPGLATLLSEDLEWWSLMEHELTIFKRASEQIEACSVVTNNYEREEGSLPEVRNYIRIKDGPWQKLTLPVSAQRPIVTDALTISLKEPTMMVVTKTHGVFLYNEEQNTWVDGNFGNYRLRTGQGIRIIRTDQSTHALVIGAEIGERANPLLKLSERNRWERLMLAISQLGRSAQ